MNADDARPDRWIAVHTHPNAETKAEFHLKRQGYEVYLPRFMRHVRHARRSELVARPLFPRYLFVRLSGFDAWRPICSTVGVGSLVCVGGQLVPVPDLVMSEIIAREDNAGMIRLNHGRKFASGEQIQVQIGTYSGLDGIFDTFVDEERVAVLLNILGRQVRARLPLDAIRTVA
jgi:transcriptional antiterminator RfaH